MLIAKGKSVCVQNYNIYNFNKRNETSIKNRLNERERLNIDSP